MNTLSTETLRTWLEEGREVSVVDVRPMAERVEWAIPGSLHIDAYEALKARDPAALASLELPTDRPVVTVCAAGKTSQIAAEQLAVGGQAGRDRAATAVDRVLGREAVLERGGQREHLERRADLAVRTGRVVTARAPATLWPRRARGCRQPS